MLAFGNARGDHSFIGVYDFARKQLRYLDPSVDRDSEAVWSADGKQIAFIRIPTSRVASAFGPKRTGDPWSIRDCRRQDGNWTRDLGSRSKATAACFAKLSADNQLFWSADNKIVFPWEKDGWTHLYSISANAEKQKATLLTPGEFEVEHVSLAPGGKEIVYSSNQGDIDHRHVWRVATAGGQAPRAITSGNGIEILSNHLERSKHGGVSTIRCQSAGARIDHFWH